MNIIMFLPLLLVLRLPFTNRMFINILIIITIPIDIHVPILIIITFLT